MRPFRRPSALPLVTLTIAAATLTAGALVGVAGASPRAAAPAAGALATAAAPVAAPVAAPNPATPGDFTGYGFDQCEAPRQYAMDQWIRHSPFRAVGIYISGDSRACQRQANLDAEWVRRQLAAGWRLLPITLGPQAACSHRYPRYGRSIDPTINPNPYRTYYYARLQAIHTARQAVARARELGIVPGSTLFYDLEAFDTRHSTDCRMSALWFMNTWTKTLHGYGYVSGYYSSAASGIRMVDDQRVRADNRMYMPDQVWIADWDGRANTSSPYIRSDGWQPYGRLKQYRGGHNETHGGVTINIDSNYLHLRTPAGFTRPQLRVVTTEQSPIRAGERATWQVTVTNVGRVSAGLVAVHGTVRGTDVRLSMTAPGGSGFERSGSSGSIDLGILAAGASRTVTVTGTLPATTSGQVLLKAFAQYGRGGYGGYQNDRACENNTTIGTDSDGCDYVYTNGVTPTPADVRVVTTEASAIRAGKTATWQVTLANVGGQTAQDLTVRSRPSNIDLSTLRSTHAGATSPAASRGVSTLAVGSLAPGARTVVTVSADVPLAASGQVLDKSWATWGVSGESGYQSDAPCRNNTTAARDTDACDYVYTNGVVPNTGDVRVLAHEPRPVRAGSTATWHVYVRNLGDDTAHDLTVTTRLTGVTAGTLRMTAPGSAGFSRSGALGILRLGTLAAGETEVVTVTGEVPAGADHQVLNKSWTRWGDGSRGYQSDHACQNNTWVSRDTDWCDYVYRNL